MDHILSFSVYFFICLLGIPVYYHIACHFLYSESVTLNYLSGFLLAGIGHFQVYIGRYGVVPYTDIVIHDRSNIVISLIPLFICFLYSLAFGIAYKKYFGKRR